MKRRLVALLAMALLLALVPSASALAKQNPKSLYMVALGDSVAAGTQQPLPFTDNGYADVLFQRVKGPMGLGELVNLACPGDDTAEMIDADGGANGSICYGSGAFLPPGGSSQLDVAEAFLLANPGKIGLITITIGANDVLACPDPTDLACIGGAVAQAAANLQVILARLGAAAPGAPVVAMNYYNPNLAQYFVPVVGPALAAGSNQIVEVANGSLEAVYGAFGVPVADVANAFGVYDERTNMIPRNVMLACRYTLMCERSGGELGLRTDPVGPDIHPSDIGHRRIAWAFEKAMKASGIL